MAPADRLQVAVPVAVGQPSQLALGVRRMARRRERRLVDVGGVDLDAVPEGSAQPFVQQHRDRVRLLARRTAGAPHPDGPVPDPLQQLREQLLGEHLPGIGVPEEARDVDQDRVEEGGELLGLQRQHVLVLVERPDTDLVHAVAHAAYQARPLVAGEVEGAVVAEELQQPLETLVHLVGGCRGLVGPHGGRPVVAHRLPFEPRVGALQRTALRPPTPPGAGELSALLDLVWVLPGLDDQLGDLAQLHVPALGGLDQLIEGVLRSEPMPFDDDPDGFADALPRLERDP